MCINFRKIPRTSKKWETFSYKNRNNFKKINKWRFPRKIKKKISWKLKNWNISKNSHEFLKIEKIINFEKFYENYTKLEN